MGIAFLCQFVKWHIRGLHSFSLVVLCTYNENGVNMNFYLAQLISKVPSTCPFARTIKIGDLKFTVPPMCKLNPFYNQIMSARVEALEATEEYDFDLITFKHFGQAFKLLWVSHLGFFSQNQGEAQHQAKLAYEFLKSPSYWVTTSDCFNKI